VIEERYFPVDSWLADMQAAVDRITQLGRSILEMHRRASDKAEEGARRWRLDERLTAERYALLSLLDGVRQIIESLNACWHAMHADPGDGDDLQYIGGQVVLKDVIEGNRHDDVIKVIRTKKGRYS
jgi:hypothetical protein